MRYKCVIFDLDGTVLESLQGILDAVNMSFKQLGFNVERTYEEAKYFIGAGAIEFARRAMKGQNIPIDREKDVMDTFLANYAKTQAEVTKPFKGIPELFNELRKNGIKVCIASNKPQMLLEPVLKQLFPNFKFDIAYGQRPNKPEKPDPFIIFEIFKELNVDPQDCVYIGDSQYDMETARNAGIDSIIVTYGYGFYDQPWIKKATYTVDSVSELKKKLLD
ncbi:MAG: HAD family hydrolase [Firmicutes bacterium]|nr:HAD family hydrolase [Candidatus Fiminaster equi]